MKYAAPIILSVLSLHATAAAQPARHNVWYTIAVCERCHGEDGNGSNDSVPRLNGQQPGYILKRLNDFLQPVPASPHAPLSMTEAAPRSTATPGEIAAFFSRQRPMTATTGGLENTGRVIFQEGLNAEGVEACRRCHGERGEGHDTVPRIAGQHPGYLKSQIWGFRFRLRENAPMHANTERLNSDQVAALASYLGEN